MDINMVFYTVENHRKSLKIQVFYTKIFIKKGGGLRTKSKSLRCWRYISLSGAEDNNF
jgi:hypothetical protein